LRGRFSTWLTTASGGFLPDADVDRWRHVLGVFHGSANPSRQVTLNLLDIACAVRRFRSAESELRRGRSSLRSGSIAEPRVCLSAVRQSNRIAGLHPRT
jgi:hypothetical protein